LAVVLTKNISGYPSIGSASLIILSFNGFYVKHVIFISGSKSFEHH